MTPDEVNEVIENIKYLYPEWQWTRHIALLEYNELYLYIHWMVGDSEERPNIKLLNEEKLKMARKALNKFLLDHYD